MRPAPALLLAALAVARVALPGEPAPAAKPTTATAAKPAKPTTATEPTKPGDPVHLWADRVRYLHQQHRALAKGNVTIIQRDLRIDCDEIVAILQPGTNTFRNVTATGNVRIHTVKPLTARPDERPKLVPVEGGRTATCQTAEYDPVKDIVVLTGTDRQQPVVQLGSDRVRGNLITFDRKKNMVVVEGDTKITALIPESAARPPTKPPTKPATSQPPK